MTINIIFLNLYKSCDAFTDLCDFYLDNDTILCFSDYGNESREILMDFYDYYDMIISDKCGIIAPKSCVNRNGLETHSEDIVAKKIMVDDKIVIIIVVYNYSFGKHMNTFNCISVLLTKYNEYNIVLLGDVNCQHPSWSAGANYTDYLSADGKKLADILTKHKLVSALGVRNDNYTHDHPSQTWLDIVFISRNIADCANDLDLPWGSHSDHKPVGIALNGRMQDKYIELRVD